MNRDWTKYLAAMLLLGVWLAGCADVRGTRQLPPGTPPEKNDWYGEFYNMREYAECRRLMGPVPLDCEYKRLTRVEEPEYWPYPHVAKPKLPEPPNPPVYRRGMNSREYFDALCKAEAGEFIYRTVDNVEGFYQIRPRKPAAYGALQDRYVMEDPYGYTDFEVRFGPSIFLTVNTKRRELPYAFLEAPPLQSDMKPTGYSRFHSSRIAPPPKGAVVERYFGVNERNESETIQKEYDQKIISNYGYTWRGIKRPRDRELGIAGGELIVVDLRTGEILGIRRGFARSGLARTRSGIQWESTDVCPRLRPEPGGPDKSIDFTRWFIAKVLKPVGTDNALEGGN